VAPGTPQFYLDVAVSFNHVSARRYYFDVTDRAYFYTGHKYFNEVFDVQGGTAIGNGPGSGDTAYLFDAAHFSVSGFPLVMTM
jgi:hypothetical protein